MYVSFFLDFFFFHSQTYFEIQYDHETPPINVVSSKRNDRAPKVMCSVLLAHKDNFQEVSS